MTFWRLTVAVVTVIGVAAVWATPITLAGHLAATAGAILAAGVAAFLTEL
jgi:hypothetical protein